MKPLYTQEEYNNAKSGDKLSCECYSCGNTFNTRKNDIRYELTSKKGNIKFCSKICFNKSQINKVKTSCANCNKEFEMLPNQYKRSVNHFCSKSCSATYNNLNKKYGIRRSKLEGFIEKQLTELYPDLIIHYNKKDTIGSELDIYIPNLNVAFELNGIFHYEPIYGIDKLNKIKSNDNNKFHLCNQHKIDLCIIDTSSQKYVKPSTSQKYLDIITNIIDERI